MQTGNCWLAQNRVATHLKFFNTFGPYKDRDGEPIIFDGGAVEKTVQAGGHRYVIDALCHFKSSSESSPLFSLEQRWNGLIAFEIYHTSKLSSNSPKCRDLESIGIPVIQIATGDPKSTFSQ